MDNFNQIGAGSESYRFNSAIVSLLTNDSASKFYVVIPDRQQTDVTTKSSQMLLNITNEIIM